MRTIIRTHEQAARVAERLLNAEFDRAWEVSIKPARRTRTLEQNAKLWAMLTDISRQVDWYGNKLSQDEWKDVFTAALNRQKVVPGIDGGFVMIGGRTSRMSVQLMSDLIELMYAFGAEHGVEWTDEEG